MRGQADTFVVAVQVEALDRTRLLSDTATALSDHHVNILSADSATGRDRTTRCASPSSWATSRTSRRSSRRSSASMACSTPTAWSRGSRCASCSSGCRARRSPSRARRSRRSAGATPAGRRGPWRRRRTGRVDGSRTRSWASASSVMPRARRTSTSREWAGGSSWSRSSRCTRTPARGVGPPSWTRPARRSRLGAGGGVRDGPRDARGPGGRGVFGAEMEVELVNDGPFTMSFDAAEG